MVRCASTPRIERGERLHATIASGRSAWPSGRCRTRLLVADGTSTTIGAGDRRQTAAPPPQFRPARRRAPHPQLHRGAGVPEGKFGSTRRNVCRCEHQRPRINFTRKLVGQFRVTTRRLPVSSRSCRTSARSASASRTSIHGPLDRSSPLAASPWLHPPGCIPPAASSPVAPAHPIDPERRIRRRRHRHVTASYPRGLGEQIPSDPPTTEAANAAATDPQNPA